MGLPVSIKGVLIEDGQIALLRNDRHEWELPGGRPEPGESPEACLKREIFEELALEVTVLHPVHAWIFPVAGKEVFILAYRCRVTGMATSLQLSDEHLEAGWFSEDATHGLNLPEGYREAIRRCIAS